MEVERPQPVFKCNQGAGMKSEDECHTEKKTEFKTRVIYEKDKKRDEV